MAKLIPDAIIDLELDVIAGGHPARLMGIQARKASGIADEAGETGDEGAAMVQPRLAGGHNGRNRMV